MADVTIISPVQGIRNVCAINSGPVWTSALIGYFFYIRTGGNQIFYKKTLDGGATWGSEVTVTSMNGIGFAIWYDRWTNGDSGTLIHIADMDGAGQSAYRALDTSDDSLTSFVSVVDLAHASDIQTTWQVQHVQICKARGGNLYISVAGRNVLIPFDEAFMRSTDAGASWTQRAVIMEDTGSGGMDTAILMPGNESDLQDIWAAYWDVSATEISLKVYDDSVNSVSETSIATGMTAHTTGQFRTFSATVRHSDNHMLLAALSDINSAVGDMRMWDINGSGSIVEKANVFTNETAHFGCHISINQQNDDVRVAYFGDGVETFANLKVYFHLSTNGGTSWGSRTLYNEGAVALVRTLHGDISIGNAGGRYELVWHTAGGSEPFLTNFNNSISIGFSAGPPPSIPLFGCGRLEIDNYVPRFGGSSINLVLTICYHLWQETIETKVAQLSLPEFEVEMLALNTTHMSIVVKGTLYAAHTIHPLSTDIAHVADDIDLEEAAILWNKDAPKTRARLVLPLTAEEREYEGVISRMTLVDNPGTEKQDFILTFMVAWNTSVPTLREWN